jgi:hypothetical protein
MLPGAWKMSSYMVNLNGYCIDESTRRSNQEDQARGAFVVYWHSKSNKELPLPADPKLRKAIIDAHDKAQGMSLKEAAYERRRLLKRSRYEKIAERPDLHQKSRLEMRSIRNNMERRINGL